MKGWRFYEEYKSPKRKVPTGNVVAVDTTVGMYAMPPFGPNAQYQYECVSAIFFQPNSPVASGGVALHYLQRRCKRVSEAKARKIHPKLFEYLEEEQ